MEHVFLARVEIARFHAETDFGQSAFGKPLKVSVVEQLAVGVQTRMTVRVQLLRAAEESDDVVFIQKRLPAGDGRQR